LTFATVCRMVRCGVLEALEFEGFDVLALSASRMSLMLELRCPGTVCHAGVALLPVASGTGFCGTTGLDKFWDCCCIFFRSF